MSSFAYPLFIPTVFRVSHKRNYEITMVNADSKAKSLGECVNQRLNLISNRYY